jgi:ABC-type transporter Mla maintaining outer membrane lipid asymmetry ATPase subunit MlaF
VNGPLIALDAVSKQYGALRPLRLQQLTVAEGEQVALLGFDRAAAEVFVNLVTGATLPDAGRITVFGRPTSAIDDSTAWLALVDRFGIVSERAVLLEQLSVVQNLAMPFTLEIEPPPSDMLARAERLASEVGLAPAAWHRPVGDLDPAGRARTRLGRAIALDPAVLLLEHVSAGLDADAGRRFARDIRVLAAGRRAATLAIGADDRFAAAVAERVLALDPASGRLSERRRGWLRRVLD